MPVTPLCERQLTHTFEWPDAPRSGRASVLQGLIRPDTYAAQQKAEAHARDGIASFASGPAFSRDQYFEKLNQFSKRAVSHTEDRKLEKPRAGDADEYPAHVNSVLHSVLEQYSHCTCRSPMTPKISPMHSTRLLLRGKQLMLGRDACFDLLVAAAPLAWDYWQDVQLRVPMYVSYPLTTA